MTQMNQHQALANLHKVVQICNSGINLNQNSSQSIQYKQGSSNQFKTLQHNNSKGVLQRNLNESSHQNITKPLAIEPKEDGGSMMITGVDV
jgi:hypothetical protein